MKVMCIKDIKNNQFLQDIEFGEILTVCKDFIYKKRRYYTFIEKYYSKTGFAFGAYYAEYFIPLSDIDEKEMFREGINVWINEAEKLDL